ncbi:MAG: endonuclease III [Devosiaceae bacterium]|nr:endonuclease III [Devosiaceae bacterium]
MTNNNKKQIPKSILSKQEIEAIFSAFEKHNPNPKGELDYVNLFTLLVAVVLSAQATDKGVNKATKELFAIADSPERMLDLGLEKLTNHIKSIGLYRNKAKNTLALSKILFEQYNSKIPNDREALISLPGVGRKTANVVLNIGFGQPTIAVDTHLFRISNRTGLAIGKTPLEIEKILLKVIPKKYLLNSHHWLILHGRYVCKARKPDCAHCIISKWCKYEDKLL